VLPFNLPEIQFLNKSRRKHHSTTWKIEIKQENTWLPWLKANHITTFFRSFQVIPIQVMSHTNQKPEEIYEKWAQTGRTHSDSFLNYSLE
jgi:hypothetical protein